MPIKAKAYAKINLFLDITGKREDGYHTLDSIFQSVSIHDEVSLRLVGNQISVVCDREDLSGESNIVYKACELFFNTVGYKGGAEIEIKKNIPVAAGLGGGSADAAATLYLLNTALNAGYSTEKLCELALSLGADVPFCLVGGTAQVGGIGEQIKKLGTPETHYVLLKEQEKQSTGKMFKIIDETHYKNDKRIENMIFGLDSSNVQIISDNLFNAFEFCWNFEDMVAPFTEFSPLGVFLSGSGPTVCAIFKSKENAQKCASALVQKGYNAFYAHSTPIGIELV